MWRFHLWSSDLKICHFGECTGCRSIDRQPESSAISTKPNLRVLKVDPLAMISLRQIVQRHGLGIMSVSRSSDEQVVARVERMLESGSLRVCRDAGADLASTEMQTSSIDGALRSVLALHATGDLKLRGRSFRFIPTGEWRRYREIGNYEIVPLEQAQEALRAMSADRQRPEGERSTLKSALGMLSDDGRSPSDGKIILLRASQDRPIVASKDDVITPSAFARAVAQKQKDIRWTENDWIEIEMIDEDGVGVAGQEYLIVAPDKSRFTGVTDSSGRARLDGIVSGQCRISFANLDNGAWRPG